MCTCKRQTHKRQTSTGNDIDIVPNYHKYHNYILSNHLDNSSSTLLPFMCSWYKPSALHCGYLVCIGLYHRAVVCIPSGCALGYNTTITCTSGVPRVCLRCCSTPIQTLRAPVASTITALEQLAREEATLTATNLDNFCNLLVIAYTSLAS